MAHNLRICKQGSGVRQGGEGKMREREMGESREKMHSSTNNPRTANLPNEVHSLQKLSDESKAGRAGHNALPDFQTFQFIL